MAKAYLFTDMAASPRAAGDHGLLLRAARREPRMSPAIERTIARSRRRQAARGQVAICVALADKLDTLVGYTGRPGATVDRMRTAAPERWAAADPDRTNRRSSCSGAAHGGVALLQLPALQSPRDLTSSSASVARTLRDDGYTANEVEAVLSQMRSGSTVPARLAAVREFGALPKPKARAAANKRIRHPEKADSVGTGVDPSLFAETPSVRCLAQLCVRNRRRSASSGGAHGGAQGARVAARRGRHFFDQVLVNAENPPYSRTRLALLIARAVVNRVADISSSRLKARQPWFSSAPIPRPPPAELIVLDRDGESPRQRSVHQTPDEWRASRQPRCVARLNRQAIASSSHHHRASAVTLRMTT